MTRMTATDVVRNSSAVLHRVCAGETIEIVRNGAPMLPAIQEGDRRLAGVLAGLPAG